MGTDTEVVVIGGGIAGSAAGLYLAARGHDVVIVERASFPRDKVCGEGLMPHGVRELGLLGIEPPGDAQPFRGIRWSARGVTAVGVFGEGRQGLGVPRRTLDEGLFAAAAAHERIEVRAPLVVRGLAVEGDGVAVQTDDGPIRARAVVGADGLHSPVRKWTGLERARWGRKRYGLRQHLRLADGVEQHPWVDVELVDGAELYVTPVGDRVVNVAALCEKDAAGGLKGEKGAGGALARWLSSSILVERFDGSVPVDEARVTGPLRQLPSQVFADRVVLVGDAAGFIDGITGEGMSSSLGSARLAAEVLSGALRAGPVTAASLEPYGARHAELVRDSRRLTELVLWGVGRRWLAERAVRNLARRPELFDRLLAIETGAEPFGSLGLAGLWQLVGL